MKGSEWSGWVFIFGTVIAAASQPEQDDYLFFNFAPVIEGGPGGKKLLAPKEYVSSIDFLRPLEESSDGITRVPWAFDVTDKDKKGRHHYDFDLWERYSSWLERKKGWGLVRRNFFSICGIRFTLEVCMDHGAGSALHNFVLKGGGVIPGIKPAQVSLVSSAGMVIVEDNLILADGGVVYHQDGLYNRTSDARIRVFEGAPDLDERKHDEGLDEGKALFDTRALRPGVVTELWGGDESVVEGRLKVINEGRSDKCQSDMLESNNSYSFFDSSQDLYVWREKMKVKPRVVVFEEVPLASI